MFEQTRKFMDVLARSLDKILNPEHEAKPKEYGFVLLVFPFGNPDRSNVNYISNGRREEIVVALKEIVARFEGHYVEQDQPTKDKLS